MTHPAETSPAIEKWLAANAERDDPREILAYPAVGVDFGEAEVCMPPEVRRAIEKADAHIPEPAEAYEGFHHCYVQYRNMREPWRGVGIGHGGSHRNPYAVPSSMKQARHGLRVLRGLCGLCGQPARTGRASCAGCAGRVSASHAKRYRQRVGCGLCPRCGQPARPGRVRCERHAKADRNRTARYYARKKEERKSQ